MQEKFRKISAGVCGIAVVAGTLTVVGTPMASAAIMVPQSASNVVADSNQQQIIDVFNGINAFRATKGLAPVKFSAQISTVSQNWSNTMASTDTFYHNPDYITGTPANWSAASEIIAARWDRSGQGLVTQWINSAGHNAIMSDANYNYMGIGVAFTDGTKATTGTRYGMYGTANLFRYDRVPANSWNSPEDYFAGRPPLTDATITVTPTAPIWGKNSYTIPNVAGVKYTVNGQEALPGTVTVSTTASTTVTVKAEAKTGYAFPSGIVNQWTANFVVATPTEGVSQAAPVFDMKAFTYTIPQSTGVDYFANGVIKAAGVYTGTGVTTITAKAKTGYALNLALPSTWTADLTRPLVQFATPAAPTFNKTNGTYTIPAVTGVVYKVAGVIKPAGVYQGTGVVTVTAAAASGYTLTSGAVSTWSGDITKPVLISVTPVAPTMTVMTKTYTIPSTKGVVYHVNGVAKPAGTYPGSGVVSITATASAGYVLAGTAKWSFTLQNTALVQPGDLVAADAKGALWNYKNRAIGGKTQLAPSGYIDAKELFVTDWNSDGTQDIVAQWKTGSLTVSYGRPTGTIDAPKIIGTSGWANYEISIAKYKKADKYPSIITKDTAGNLWNYTNPSGAAHGARVLEGTGWTTLQINALDWDKDGSVDILAKNSAGNVLLYRTDGVGNFQKETRKTIVSGWTNYKVQSISGYTTAGSQGLLATDSATGILYYYGTGKGTLDTRVSEGLGWNPMNIAGS